MKTMNYRKYRPYPGVDIPDRTWPDNRITKAPIWCSVDLRDGNQALADPMGVEAKLEFFRMLTAIGFKEIEAGFPAASAAEFQFVRRLIEESLIPPDVTIQVLTQAREDVIRRTFEAVKGADKVTVHIYNSTSPVQREIVFGKSKKEIVSLAVEAARLTARLKKEYRMPGVRLEYSPESFTATELDYALEICEAVLEAWDFTGPEKPIINLPATVEMSTPNIYADRIEWFSRRIKRRGEIVLSVHTHNDRGCGVAAAELAVMAGADRVEGALFGNGERSGNMDIVTMALNLLSQGVDPELDFSRIDGIAEVYERLTGMTVHPRHPYAGELVYTAFSGSHQDAIKKGMRAAAAQKSPYWEVPYLAVDPGDVNRSYESLIRINSQSGKAGMSYVLEKDYGLNLPKWMQKDFSRAAQKAADVKGKELTSGEIYGVFESEYFSNGGPFRLKSCHIDSTAGESGKEGPVKVAASVEKGGETLSFESSGNGPLHAFVSGMSEILKTPFGIEEYAEHALTRGSDAKAAAYVRIKSANGEVSCGTGTGTDISQASVKAVVSACNRLPIKL